MRINALRQAFLIHGKGIHMEFLNSAFYFSQKILVNSSVHIADGNIGVGAFSCIHNLDPHFRIADTTADQRRIKNQSLDETVPGSSQHFILFRFADASGRVCAAVYGECLLISVNQHAWHAGQKLGYQEVFLRLQPYLAVWQVQLGKFVCRIRHCLRFNAPKGLEDTKQRIILCKTVNKIDTGIPSADADDTVYHIKVDIGTQQLFKALHIGLQFI